jgi:hypothetical protein
MISNGAPPTLRACGVDLWSGSTHAAPPGEVTDRTGFSIDTLRYYERIGPLADIAGTSGGQHWRIVQPAAGADGERRRGGARAFSDGDMVRVAGPAA